MSVACLVPSIKTVGLIWTLQELQTAKLPSRLDQSLYAASADNYLHPVNIGGADNSLARPGRKQATATEDFDVHISYL